ncbi:MAG: hypothetical protein MUF79_04840 [Burkholderiales bacterium]|nr:hypothetical protein [Burkholderiales bacterium]
MQHQEMYSPSQDFVHLSRRLQPGERVPACPSLVEQLLAASAAVARTDAPLGAREPDATESTDAEDWAD